MSDTNNRTLTIERTFAAPLQLVWDAWTQSAHIAQWWGPQGMETQVIEHDFQPGGKWKYEMAMPDGSKFIAEGVYAEIVLHQKIITTADFKPMTVGVEMHVHFAAEGDQTKMTFQVLHPTEAYAQQQAEMGFNNGWGSVFGRLEEFLGKLVA